MKPVDIFCKQRSRLGEAPAWDGATKSLIWVDIRGNRVIAKSLKTEKISWWEVNLPSAAIPTGGNDLIVPAGRTLMRLDRARDRWTSLVELPGEPITNRCNDAKCDPFGQIWLGTMDSDETKHSGRLWRISGHLGADVMLSGIGIPNTLAWDNSRSIFYLADSMTGDIHAFDHDCSTGEILNRRLFFGRDAAPGVPDGSAIDEEGCLWNARWDGGCVIRISPQGKIDRRIAIPARRPTSCAFGDKDLKTLFISSAVDSDYQSDRDQFSGAVFCARLNAAGSPIPPACDFAASVRICVAS